MPGSRAERRPAVTRKAGVRAPPWQRIARGRRSTARISVGHAEDAGSNPAGHTSIRYRDKGGGDMPTNINDKLISWASDIDTETIRQAEKTARLPIVEGHVALMADAHLGIGATVGSVIPTKNAVIPSAVGVDIGCGMIAAELDLFESRLPDNLEPLLGRKIGRA